MLILKLDIKKTLITKNLQQNKGNQNSTENYLSLLN